MRQYVRLARIAKLIERRHSLRQNLLQPIFCNPLRRQPLPHVLFPNRNHTPRMPRRQNLSRRRARCAIRPPLPRLNSPHPVGQASDFCSSPVAPMVVSAPFQALPIVHEIIRGRPVVSDAKHSDLRPPPGEMSSSGAIDHIGRTRARFQRATCGSRASGSERALPFAGEGIHGVTRPHCAGRLARSGWGSVPQPARCL